MGTRLASRMAVEVFADAVVAPRNPRKILPMALKDQLRLMVLTDGALATALQLWLSGTARLEIVLPAMLTVHALIGLGEALITVAALGFIFRTRPDLLDEESASARGSRGWILAGALTALLVVFLSPFASSNPDGLERVAADLGFLQSGRSAPFQLIPDYSLPILGETAFSTIVAGMLGLIVVGVIIVLLGQAMKAKS